MGSCSTVEGPRRSVAWRHHPSGGRARYEDPWHTFGSLAIRAILPSVPHPIQHFTGARTAASMSQVGKPLVNGLQAEDSVSEPGVPHHGWQCKAMRPVNECFLEGVVLDASRVLLCSQSGPFASLPSPVSPLPFMRVSTRSRSVCFCSPLTSSTFSSRSCQGCWARGWSLPQRGYAGKQAAV